jgi:ribosomal protein S12 methylthiotransferase accessory factor
MLRAFDFLRNSSEAPADWTSARSERAVDDLHTIAAHLEELGTDLLYCNLTTPDVLPFGVHTVRVLIPDFQPIHFGRAERRLGGTRLYEVPRRLGLRETIASVVDLNDLPHPLA